MTVAGSHGKPPLNKGMAMCESAVDVWEGDLDGKREMNGSIKIWYEVVKTKHIQGKVSKGNIQSHLCHSWRQDKERQFVHKINIVQPELSSLENGKS